MKVHAVENNTYDDLILGIFARATNIDPDVLGGITGRTTYNAAQGKNSLWTATIFLGCLYRQ